MDRSVESTHGRGVRPGGLGGFYEEPGIPEAQLRQLAWRDEVGELADRLRALRT